jgi:hypothetical protein
VDIDDLEPRPVEKSENEENDESEQANQFLVHKDFSFHVT